MADDGANITIDEALVVRLKAAADAVGEDFHDFVRNALEAFADQPTDRDEVERICDETVAKGDGIAWRDFEPRLRSLGQRGKSAVE